MDSKSIIVLLIMLVVVGNYDGFCFSIAVFPSSNFPRIIIGVDNGVMPINQMEVTIPRPLENAVNSVPGLEDVRSVTSRGSAEGDLFFNLSVDMVQTRHPVDNLFEIRKAHLCTPVTLQTPL